MGYVKWAFYAIVTTVVLAALHYTLPQWDVVRVTDTYEKRVNPGSNAWFYAQADAGSDPGVERDVFFIQTKTPDDKVIVYRNEDTGWGWPPYFKFDTSDLQAEAADVVSTSEAPKWVAIKHYGWRWTVQSIFPNALRLKPVDGPEARIIPWTSIGILVVLFATFWAIRVRVIRFWDNRIAPLFDGR